MPFLLVVGALLLPCSSGVLFEHDIFRATCAGGTYWFPGSNVEVGLDMTSQLDQEEAFFDGVYQEAKQACPALQDEEFQRRFVPGLHAIVNFLDKKSVLTSDCPGTFARGFATDAPWTLMANTMAGENSPVAAVMAAINPILGLSQVHNVGAADEVNKFDLQSTCTYQSLLSTGQCSFEVDLTNKFAMKLQVAATLCPNSHVRHAVGVTCAGEGCSKLITSCSTDADCGSTMQCEAPFKGKDFTDEQVNSVFRAFRMLGTNDNRRRLGEQLSSTFFGDADALSDALGDPVSAVKRLLSRAQSRSSTLDMVQSQFLAARRWLASATQGLWGQQRTSERTLRHTGGVDEYNPGNLQLAKLIQMIANFLEFDIPASVSVGISNLKVCAPKGGWGAVHKGWAQCNSETTAFNSASTVGNFVAQQKCLDRGCWSVRLVGDGICDTACNNAECFNDGGDCNNWVQGYPPSPRMTRSGDTFTYYRRSKKTQDWRETECNGLLSPWDGKLPNGDAAMSPARARGDDLTSVNVVMPQVVGGASMGFTACDGSFGFSMGAKRTTWGGRIPKMQAFFAAMANYVTQFQEERFQANGLINGPTTQQLRQLFMPWTPFYVLNMTSVAGVPVEAPVTPKGVKLAYLMPLQDYTSGKRVMFPQGATCSAQDYALGKVCNLRFTKLSEILFSQPSSALDIALSWRQCYNGPTAMPVFGFAMTGSAIESMIPIRECDATTTSGRRLRSRHLTSSCPSNMQCEDLTSTAQGALDAKSIRGIPVYPDPMGNILFGNSNYQLGERTSQTAVSSQYKMMNVMNKFILSLDGDSSTTSRGTLSYCMPVLQTQSPSSLIKENGNLIAIDGLEVNQLNVLGGCTTATGSCSRRIPSYTMRQRVSIALVSEAAFTPRVQRAIKRAYARKLNVPINQIAIVMMVAESDSRRLANGVSVSFDVVINAADPTQKSALLSTMVASSWKTDLQSAITDEFQQDNITTSVTVTSVAAPVVAYLTPPGEDWSPSGSSGLAASAIAGAVIGSLFAVALVGLVIVKRKRNRTPVSPITTPHKSAASATETSMSQTDQAKPGALQVLLSTPEPLKDQTVQTASL